MDLPLVDDQQAGAHRSESDGVADAQLSPATAPADGSSLTSSLEGAFAGEEASPAPPAPAAQTADARVSALKALAGIGTVVSKSRKVDAEALQLIKQQRAKAKAEQAAASSCTGAQGASSGAAAAASSPAEPPLQSQHSTHLDPCTTSGNLARHLSVPSANGMGGAGVASSPPSNAALAAAVATSSGSASISLPGNAGLTSSCCFPLHAGMGGSGAGGAGPHPPVLASQPSSGPSPLLRPQRSLPANFSMASYPGAHHLHAAGLPGAAALTSAGMSSSLPFPTQQSLPGMGGGLQPSAATQAAGGDALGGLPPALAELLPTLSVQELLSVRTAVESLLLQHATAAQLAGSGQTSPLRSATQNGQYHQALLLQQHQQAQQVVAAAHAQAQAQQAEALAQAQRAEQALAQMQQAQRAQQAAAILQSLSGSLSASGAAFVPSRGSVPLQVPAQQPQLAKLPTGAGGAGQAGQQAPGQGQSFNHRVQINSFFPPPTPFLTIAEERPCLSGPFAGGNANSMSPITSLEGPGSNLHGNGCDSSNSSLSPATSACLPSLAVSGAAGGDDVAAAQQAAQQAEQHLLGDSLRSFLDANTSWPAPGLESIPVAWAATQQAQEAGPTGLPRSISLPAEQGLSTARSASLSSYLGAPGGDEGVANLLRSLQLDVSAPMDAGAAAGAAAAGSLQQPASPPSLCPAPRPASYRSVNVRFCTATDAVPAAPSLPPPPMFPLPRVNY